MRETVDEFVKEMKVNRILYLAAEKTLHQVMVDVGEIMVDVKLDEVIDFGLATPTEFCPLLPDEVMRTFFRHTSR